jgi:hypothetical protein
MVTYANAHYVFRILGSNGSTASAEGDDWSTGFRLGTALGDVPSNTNLQPFLTAVAPAIQAFHTSPAVPAGITCWLKELTIARVGTDGKYNPSSAMTTRHTYAPALAGLGTPTKPWNTALVISLRTTIPRGIASNGRTYYPATAAGLSASTGRLIDTTRNAFIDQAAIMIRAVNTAASANLASTVSVIVAGQSGVTGPARTAAVTSIRGDLRLDSIERRENAQPPDWYQVAL